MTLHDFQTNFKSLMLSHPDALKKPTSEFSAYFESNHIPLPRRLSVYRNNIIGGLTDVMLATFPLIEALVGTEFLEGMARSFILQYPPAQGCLNSYGAGFAEFIAEFEPARTLPYLPDVARLELAIAMSYSAPDQSPLLAEHLAMIAPDNLGDMQLSLCDYVHLIDSPYPLLAIHAFCENPEESPAVNMNAAGTPLMVRRHNLETDLLPLTAHEYYALSALKNGDSLRGMMLKTLEHFPDFDVQVFLQKHLFLETFLSLPPNASERETML